MFIGHFGVGFAAAGAHPGPSLGTYLAAAVLPDFLWAVFLLLGWERVVIAPGDTAVTPLRFVSYPLSHSLVADVGWAAAFAGLYWLGRRDGRAAAWLALVVVSHWVLDVISHRPDVPLAPGWDTVLGLGLWNSLPATILVEGAIFAAGVLLYVRAARGLRRSQRYGLAALVGFLVAAYAASLAGPPPPGARAIAIGNLVSAALLPWAAWADRGSRRGARAT